MPSSGQLSYKSSGLTHGNEVVAIGRVDQDLREHQKDFASASLRLSTKVLDLDLDLDLDHRLSV